MDNTELKDRVSQLFIGNSSALIHLEAPDGAYTDAKFQNGLVEFFEPTMFSKNPGELRGNLGNLMESVVKVMQDVGDAAAQPPVSQQEYEGTHGGYSQQDHVEAMAGLAAMVWKAAENRKDGILEEQKAREETAKMFIGLAFAFVPGASDVIGKVSGEGASFLANLANDAIKYV